MNQIIKDFRSTKNQFITYLKGDVEKVTMICALIGVPLIAAWTFVKEAMPEHTELANQKIERLINFYGYKRETKDETIL